MLLSAFVLPMLGLITLAEGKPVAAAAKRFSSKTIAKRGARVDYRAHQHRADAVKEAFQRSWDGYYTYAFPHDSLKPIAKSWQDDRNGWGASAVDALSTALIMGNEKVVKQIVEFIPKINFDNTTTEISLFETTIRYLGGLLSGYDLLSGPLNKIYTDSAAIKKVLDQAEHLASNLKVAFDTPSGVPDNAVLANPFRIKGSLTNGLATTGTLVLEWTRLSDLTGNPIYGDIAQKAEDYLVNPHPKSSEPFPGLVGSDINITTGNFIDDSGGWVGGTDSFYEYLIKMYLYDPVRFKEYKDRWVLAVESSMKHLASHPTTRPDLTFLATYRGKQPLFHSQHLACFDGGNFILGGLTLNEPRYVDFGLTLTAGCHDTYVQTATGIGPESFSWQDSAATANTSTNPPAPADQADFYARSGFWIDSSDYVLRPEVIESYYYAYRATGDAKYQEWAWDAFLAINKTCSYGVGFSGVSNVNKAGGGAALDFQESFWFAEVLKYSYLIQAEEGPWQVSAEHGNKFVYNTEAHPIAIPGGEGGQGR